MFLESSRYYKVKTRQIITNDGRSVNSLTLRRIPMITGNETIVKENDKLDIISFRNYGNASMFWYISDANTELYAPNLVKNKTERVKTILVPEK